LTTIAIVNAGLCGGAFSIFTETSRVSDQLLDESLEALECSNRPTFRIDSPGLGTGWGPSGPRPEDVELLLLLYHESEQLVICESPDFAYGKSEEENEKNI
jgi:hypothetical protein